LRSFKAGARFRTGLFEFDIQSGGDFKKIYLKIFGSLGIFSTFTLILFVISFNVLKKKLIEMDDLYLRYKIRNDILVDAIIFKNNHSINILILVPYFGI
jgi:hypothetical protein